MYISNRGQTYLKTLLGLSKLPLNCRFRCLRINQRIFSLENIKICLYCTKH